MIWTIIGMGSLIFLAIVALIIHFDEREATRHPWPHTLPDDEHNWKE